ncbi:MAG: sigma-54-dependent Fis family transcriptional regulator [Ktedonobacterales bacterium]|nr:sigma-54-dependent Fis family transcriptional regulator [Ktedonobacterales bacterium]
MDERPTLTDALILLVEDNDTLAQFTANQLRAQGARVQIASTLAEGAAFARKETIDLALLDLHLPDGISTSLLASLRTADPEMPVIMMTERASVGTAVESMKLGAVDYLEKPYQPADLDRAIDRAMTLDGLRREVRTLRRLTGGDGPDTTVRGTGPAMSRVWHDLDQVAPYDSNVLILGENGTGKEVLARAIHAASGRSRGPFIPVNCGGMPETLVEDQLFGHEAHAFTDARALRRGDFELAHKGTIFLDEIGEMPPAAQPNLLRVLEGRRFFRIGGEAEVHVDVRVISATNRDLEEAVARNQFRQDLLFRLNVFTIRVPPLRERREDIPLLIAMFLRELGRSLSKPKRKISLHTLRLLTNYTWPGNVRQLRNVLERALILCAGQEILPEHLPPEITGQQDPALTAPDPDALWERWFDIAPFEAITLNELKAQIERRLIMRTLRQTGGNHGETARILGVPDLSYYLGKHHLLDGDKRDHTKKAS